jgi:hypothetical protein
MLCFDPEKIIKKFQAGAWTDYPYYWVVYNKIWQKQSAVLHLAEKLRLLQRREETHEQPKPLDLKTQLALFEEQRSKALQNNDTCYLRNLLRAAEMLRKHGRPKWQFRLPDLICLATIHLRENLQRLRFNTTDLHKLIDDWLEANGQSAFDKSDWRKALKRPEVVELLRRLNP